MRIDIGMHVTGHWRVTCGVRIRKTPSKTDIILVPLKTTMASKHGKHVALLALGERNTSVISAFPSQMISNMELWFFCSYIRDHLLNKQFGCDLMGLDACMVRFSVINCLLTKRLPVINWNISCKLQIGSQRLSNNDVKSGKYYHTVSHTRIKGKFVKQFLVSLKESEQKLLPDRTHQSRAF